MKREDYTTEKIVKTLLKCYGIKTATAKKLGVTRQTLHKWINDDAELKKAVTEAEEQMADFYEDAVVKLVKEKDPATIRWAASRKLRHRGYGDKLTVQTETPVTENLDDLPPEELQKRFKQLSERIESAI